MTNPKSRMIAAVAGVLSVSAAAAWAADANQDQKIQALEQKVAALEAQQAQNSKDLAATIDSVLRDAERRSQLLAVASDSSAGYDDGFVIRSGEAYSLKIGANFQFRSVYDYRSGTGGDKSDEIENGYEIRRMQFGLGGNLIKKDMTYYFQWNTVRDSTGEAGVFLEDAWVKDMFNDQWGMRVGQWKDMVTHEKMTSDSKLVAVERSMVDQFLGGGYLDRVQGVTVIYGGRGANNPLNAEIGVIDGSNSKGSNYIGHYPGDPGTIGDTSSPSNHNFDYGIAGRVEWLASGTWKEYEDLTAKGTKDSLFALGGGFDWSEGGNGNSVVGTIDAQFETKDGLGVYGAALVKFRDGEINGTGDDKTDWGLLLQVSYLLSPQWEIFGRWDGIWYDNEIVNDEDNFHELSVGVVYYLGKDGSALHHAKITMDLNWLPNGAPASATGLGYLGDSSGEDEVALRTQFQLQL